VAGTLIHKRRVAWFVRNDELRQASGRVVIFCNTSCESRATIGCSDLQRVATHVGSVVNQVSMALIESKVWVIT